MRGVDALLREAVIEVLDGREPDNFIESAFGGAVDGPPDPHAEAEELKLMQDLEEQIREEISEVENAT